MLETISDASWSRLRYGSILHPFRRRRRTTRSLRQLHVECRHSPEGSRSFVGFTLHSPMSMIRIIFLWKWVEIYRFISPSKPHQRAGAVTRAPRRTYPFLPLVSAFRRIALSEGTILQMIWSDGERTFVGRTRSDINTLHHRLLDLFGEERREMKQSVDTETEQPESSSSSRTPSPTATDSNATPTPAVGTLMLCRMARSFGFCENCGFTLNSLEACFYTYHLQYRN